MTLLEAQQFTDLNIKYKNAFFKFKRDLFAETISIHMFMDVKDSCANDYSYENAPSVKLSNIAWIPEDHFSKMNEKELTERLYRLCIDMELHEVKEHFKLNNKFYKDPHPETKIKIDFCNKL